MMHLDPEVEAHYRNQANRLRPGPSRQAIEYLGAEIDALRAERENALADYAAAMTIANDLQERIETMRQWVFVAVNELGTPQNIEYLGKPWWDEGEALAANGGA